MNAEIEKLETVIKCINETKRKGTRNIQQNVSS
jgi:hypothetical protein